MESVSLHAFIVVRPRQAEHPLVLRHRSVEGGIEAGNLRHAREETRRGPNLSQVVRLMQRGERDERLQIRQYLRGDADRGGKTVSAVDDAVPDSRNGSPRQPRRQGIEHSLQGRRAVCCQLRAESEFPPFPVFEPKSGLARRVAGPFDPGAQVQPVSRERGKLQA